MGRSFQTESTSNSQVYISPVKGTSLECWQPLKVQSCTVIRSTVGYLSYYNDHYFLKCSFVLYLPRKKNILILKYETEKKLAKLIKKTQVLKLLLVINNCIDFVDFPGSWWIYCCHNTRWSVILCFRKCSRLLGVFSGGWLKCAITSV